MNGSLFNTASLLRRGDGTAQDEIALTGPTRDDGSEAWVDARLVAAGLLTAANVGGPRTLDEGSSVGDTTHAAALVTPGNPRDRCCPHHFDIAVLCMPEEGDPETECAAPRVSL
ncbi:MAG: hypothetical protein CMQ24_19365 [Gammaproteobacteria bacterium]|nr:hypothetical protein [Gammaproteobacteria bacterium]